MVSCPTRSSLLDGRPKMYFLLVHLLSGVGVHVVKNLYMSPKELKLNLFKAPPGGDQHNKSKQLLLSIPDILTRVGHLVAEYAHNSDICGICRWWASRIGRCIRMANPLSYFFVNQLFCHIFNYRNLINRSNGNICQYTMKKLCLGLFSSQRKDDCQFVTATWQPGRPVAL